MWPSQSPDNIVQGGFGNPATHDVLEIAQAADRLAEHRRSTKHFGNNLG